MDGCQGLEVEEMGVGELFQEQKISVLLDERMISSGDG